MRNSLRDWIAKRQELRRLWRADAQQLIERDERNAFYDAQRLVAKSRARGDLDGMVHWTKVAAEVARRSDVAEMNFAVLKQIADEEHENDGS